MALRAIADTEERNGMRRGLESTIFLHGAFWSTPKGVGKVDGHIHCATEEELAIERMTLLTTTSNHEQFLFIRVRSVTRDSPTVSPFLSANEFAIIERRIGNVCCLVR
jgi:hypothetical protein